MISRDGNDHLGHVRLDPLGPNRTLLHFDEQADMDPDVYAFINKHNEDHMRAASQYLTDHPEYRARPRRPRVVGRDPLHGLVAHGAAVDAQHPRQRHGFEQAAVVGDEQHGAREGVERGFELLDRGDVEVVRRLVEHERVHARGLEQGQCGPRALAR